jgi:hypothetical protein
MLQMPLPIAPEPPPRATRAISPAEEAALSGAVGGIADDPLREALLALGRTVAGSRR